MKDTTAQAVEVAGPEDPSLGAIFMGGLRLAAYPSRPGSPAAAPPHHPPPAAVRAISVDGRMIPSQRGSALSNFGWNLLSKC